VQKGRGEGGQKGDGKMGKTGVHGNNCRVGNIEKLKECVNGREGEETGRLTGKGRKGENRGMIKIARGKETKTEGKGRSGRDCLELNSEKEKKGWFV